MSLEKLKKDTFNQMCQRGEIATNSDNEKLVNELIQIGFDHRANVDEKWNLLIPRKNDIARNTAEELSIRNAINAVEKLGASDKITKIVVTLIEALEQLHEYVDEHLND